MNTSPTAARRAASSAGPPPPESIPSLQGNFSWTLAGNGVVAVSQLGIIVILARLGSPLTLGQFSLALAVTAPVFILLNLKLRAVQATDAHGEYQFSEYFALRAVTSLCLPIVVTLIALDGPRYW